MKKTEFRAKVMELLSDEVTGLTWDLKIAIVKQCVIDVEQKQGFDESNKGQKWTDEELRIVLTMAPTKENCARVARAFIRGYGSIEQIYRWAASSDDEIKEKRPDHAFVQQIKRVAKEVGWRAT